MSVNMIEASIKYQHTIDLKKNRRFSRILKSLVKSENLLTEIKVTVSDGEIIEDKEQFFITPTLFKRSFENYIYNSFDNKNENLVENLNSETKPSSPNDFKAGEYPDSSDFSDDE